MGEPCPPTTEFKQEDDDDEAEEDKEEDQDGPESKESPECDHYSARRGYRRRKVG